MSNANDFVIENGYILDYTGLDEIIEVPSAKEVCESVFECNPVIKKVIFKSVDKIDRAAFMECKRLKEVVLPDGLVNIGDGAFMGCEHLESITTLESVTEIGDRAFFNCKKLKTVNISNGIENVKKEVFVGCELLCDKSGLFIYDNILCCVSEKATKVTIPKEVEIVGGRAFRGCEQLVSVVIPNNVTELGNYAFEDCKNLSYIKLPDHYTDALSIQNLFDKENVPAYLVTPALEASKHKTQTLKISALCGYIHEPLLHTDIVAQKNEKYIYTQRKKLYPASVGNLTIMKYMVDHEIIQKEEFADVLHMATNANNTEVIALLLDYKDKHFRDDNKKITSISMSAKELNKLWSTKKMDDGTLEITGYKGNDTELIIPSVIGKSLVTSVSDYAFSPYRDRITNQQRTVLKSITSIVVPEDVVKLGKGAFRACSALSSVVIPGTIKEISELCFDECKELKTVIISEGVEKIGEGAFGGCSNLESITIPDSVIRISEDAFSGCLALCNKDDLFIAGGILFCCRNTAQQIAIPEGVEIIADSAFANCSNLKSIEFTDNLKKISSCAFSGCSALSSITIPGSVKIVEKNAFELCLSLTRVTISDGVEIIGNSVFYGCSSLTSLLIPKSVSSIGCALFGNMYVKRNSELAIYGKPESKAEVYAKENNIPFVVE